MNAPAFDRDTRFIVLPGGDEDADTMARAIADMTCMSDIECYCATVGGDAMAGWMYDTTRPSEELEEKLDQSHCATFEEYQEDIARAVRYLDARKLLARDPDRPHVVRLRKEAAP